MLRWLHRLSNPVLTALAVLAASLAHVDVETKILWQRLRSARMRALARPGWRSAVMASLLATLMTCVGSVGALNADNLIGGPANIWVGDLPKAVLTTSMTGSNNDVKIEAYDGGAAGNSIQFAIVDPASTSTPISVAVTGTAPAYTITVTAAVDGSSAITSTATEVKNAINTHIQAKGLVVASVKAGDTGAGVVTALSATGLTGGSDTAVMADIGYLGAGGARVTPGVATLDFRGQQAGRAPVKRVIAETSFDVDITIAEVLQFENLARAYSQAVLISDGSSKKRIEWRDATGRDLLAAARRWEIRPIIGNAETSDPQKILVIPRASPAVNSQPMVYELDTQRTVTFTLNGYPDSYGRRAFMGNEDF